MGSFKIHVDAVLQPGSHKKNIGVVGRDLTGLLITGIGSIYALSSVDMAEAHALTLRKGSDLAFSLQLSSVCMYENRFISGLESFS